MGANPSAASLVFVSVVDPVDSDTITKNMEFDDMVGKSISTLSQGKERHSSSSANRTEVPAERRHSSLGNFVDEHILHHEGN